MKKKIKEGDLVKLTNPNACGLFRSEYGKVFKVLDTNILGVYASTKNLLLKTDEFNTYLGNVIFLDNDSIKLVSKRKLSYHTLIMTIISIIMILCPLVPLILENIPFNIYMGFGFTIPLVFGLFFFWDYMIRKRDEFINKRTEL